ncbi:vascular endothelial growth factor D isoform X1 [Sinocyclocheilus anshuiensis]|uniref:Platelet-derived growth factor (PDGF) family profile domain-containing protein n=1 Tax=Sinocyclocheilus anshuiensis TaxID=1608454 RepID=A0A671T852_9TELE|nr:PREDICTED: vascular endothelial growth factor D isoform X1 [Sinocyclocheilus anshuiensis]
MKTQKCAGLHMLLLLYVRLMLAVDAYRPQRDINQERWEQELREAGSLDELLMLTEYPDWKLWRCRLQLKHFEYATPPENRRSTRYAAASFSPEMLKDIDDEWQKTQCMPRETCVDVAKELGTNTAVFFKPPCVSVFRCGGCCNKEGVTCRNTSVTYVNKTILSVSLAQYKTGPEPVLVKIANHTECMCQEHSLIRRHVREKHKKSCSPTRKPEDKRLCNKGLIWDWMAERCVTYPSSKQEPLSTVSEEDCEIDVERCECIPKVWTHRLHHT